MEKKHAEQVSQIANLIWKIADDYLRNNWGEKTKNREVILPMITLRRLDLVLEPTKQAVLERKKILDSKGIQNQSSALCKASGHAFYNTSPFCLKDLTSRTKSQQLLDDFKEYLNGFSENVQDIIWKFDFLHLAERLADAGILSGIINEFVSSQIYLGMDDVLDSKGNVLYYGMDNHMVGTLFEEVLRKFNDENNEAAGAFFTPRDVVELMADLIFTPISDKILDGTYVVYDGACGTGGMLTVGEQRLNELAEASGKNLAVHLFGQESVGSTYAICKADLLIKNKGGQADNIYHGSTLSNDGFAGKSFDFMLSNPPFGTSWKNDAENMSKRLGEEPDLYSRFVIPYEGGELDMIPRSSDGQLMFLANNVSKMKTGTKLGSRIAEVHNGSSLFTGDAGSGESNFRRYIFEQDLVEAIIALPENIFYNTGIATYIWILANKKSPERKGKVQLIDATSFKTSLRRNMGKKNCEVDAEGRKRIMELYASFADSEYSLVLPNEAFGYQKVTVERPLRDEAGEIIRDKKGKPKADSALRDTENIPLLYDGGVDAYMEKEVLPFVPDAWVDESKTKIGYELSFTKYFYKPEAQRDIAEIAADLRRLEEESAGMLKGILE